MVIRLHFMHCKNILRLRWKHFETDISLKLSHLVFGVILVYFLCQEGNVLTHVHLLVGWFFSRMGDGKGFLAQNCELMGKKIQI